MWDNVLYSSSLLIRETETGFRGRGRRRGVALSDLALLEYFSNKTFQLKKGLNQIQVASDGESENQTMLTLIEGTIGFSTEAA